MEDKMMSLPMVALRGMTVLPEQVIHFDLSRSKSLKAIEQSMKEEQKIFFTSQKNAETNDPGINDVYHMGCVASIKQIVKYPKNLRRILIKGEQRARLEYLEQEEPFLRADILAVPDTDEKESLEFLDSSMGRTAMMSGLKEIFKEYSAKNPKLSKEYAHQIEGLQSLRELVDTIAAVLPMTSLEAQGILEQTELLKRFDAVSDKMMNEIQIIGIKEEIQAKLKERVDKNQREYVLREEMKLIREELKEDHVITDAEEFQKQVDSLKAVSEVKEKLYKEINRFKSSMNSPAEAGVIRTYIETMLELPWDACSEERQDMKYAKKVLDRDHYGLEKVKERILEYLAVRILTGKGEAPLLCLFGPPGTGKTSIAKSLAAALNRPYVRISLGGVRDEAEIRGHRKTYVGAMPGRIAAGLMQAGVKNPLMLLDEIDKVSNDYKGDTFSALLEVLDSEQNSKFRDHYLEVPLDLSDVLFITTANTLQTIPKPLLDRMEIIEVNSYTENEKLHIAQEHLLPKQLKRHGIKEGQLTVSKKAIWRIARNYTKEAGVRQLERKLGDICRKTAREIIEKDKKYVRITERNLEHYLGRELYMYQPANEKDEVGIVRGLAWTSVGGDTLQIEVNTMPGEGEILLTGQLGDVMKESARAGISYIRSVSKKYKIEETFFKEHDIHIHIPEGAVPKDGPSAGITMAVAILSAATGKRVRADVAMTGEITLRGRVLPIGGLKEKLLAAKNAGIKTVIVPEDNKADVKELSEEITKGLDILYVPHMDEVLKAALVSGKGMKGKNHGN